MKTMCKLMMVLISVFFIIRSATAQNQIGISSVITNFKDTVVVNQSVSYKVYVKNYGPAVFTGYFRINTYVDSTYNQSGNFHFSRLDTLFSPVTLQPGDSVAFQTGDTYDLATYKMGGNTVVVWPITYQEGWSTRDSVYHPVFVRNNITAIGEISNDRGIHIYPNPVTKQLRLNFNNNDFEDGVITIVDLLGNKVMEVGYTPKIDVESLEKGIYIIQFTNKEGAVSQQRFVKE